MRLLLKKGMKVIKNFQDVVDEPFYLKRNFGNRLAKLTWYSNQLNYLVYFSRLSGAFHKII